MQQQSQAEARDHHQLAVKSPQPPGRDRAQQGGGQHIGGLELAGDGGRHAEVFGHGLQQAGEDEGGGSEGEGAEREDEDARDHAW